MSFPGINCLPLSDASADKIQHQASAITQTIGRLQRTLERAKVAAQRGNKSAQEALMMADDALYTVLAELRLEESEWE